MQILLFVLLFLILPIGLALCCMLSVHCRDFSPRGRTTWMFVLMILPFLGPLLYVLLGLTRSRRVR